MMKISRWRALPLAAGVIAGVSLLAAPGASGAAHAPSASSQVFNNVLADPSFGVTSPVFLDQLTPSGHLLAAVPVPSRGGLVTSFSSKSELALNLSTSGRAVSLLGYAATTAGRRS